MSQKLRREIIKNQQKKDIELDLPFQKDIFELEKNLTFPLKSNTFYLKIVNKCQIKDNIIKYFQNGNLYSSISKHPY